MDHTKVLTKCFVLSKKNFGEGHVIISLLTQDHGIIKVSAFGGQRLSKRFKGCLDYFKLIEAELEHKTKNDTTMSCISSVKSVIHDFKNIGSKIERFAAASYIQELCTIILTPDDSIGQSGSNFFLNLHNALYKLETQDTAEDILSTVYEFAITLYTETGFLPDIKRMDGTKRRIDHLEEFNSRILGCSPKSFAVLENVINQ